MSQSIDGDEDVPKSVLARIEKNRQRAIILRQSKLVSHPYSKGEVISVDTTTYKIGAKKYKDTGGGFLLEEPEYAVPDVAVQEEGPIHEDDRPTCKKCNKLFATSWLFDNFLYKCCDECKDPEEHKLIAKTEAINEYLLKPVDFEKREPPLKFITRKNPHNVRWGDMKLYLQLQIEERALQIWGDKETIEKEKEIREEKKVATKAKKYNKELKALRMNIRSSLYDRTTSLSHTHEFGSEIYNSEEDNYTRKCEKCPYEETFEKM